jgi:Zn-dependent protease/predicted transcriptional regulator
MTVAGIPVRIHFTFFLFLALLAVLTSPRGGLFWTGLIVAVFACVLLHEFGHALVARKYGVSTRDITLYPIGGVAMLEGRPTAKSELWIALAGPAVNLVIAAALGAYLLATNGGLPPFSIYLTGMGFIESLFMANVILALFNMIPAFPMDGGRVLRSLLARGTDDVKATRIAGTIGQGLAIGLGFVGLFGPNPLLMLVAFFGFVGAGQEVAYMETRSFVTGHKIVDAMQRRFRTIPHGATLEQAAQMLLAGSQSDFPVVHGDDVVGVLTRNDIATGLASQGQSAYVATHMRREFKKSAPDLPLTAAMDLFTKDDPTPILVFNEGELQGMVTQENLSEFIMLEHARKEGQKSFGYTA